MFKYVALSVIFIILMALIIFTVSAPTNVTSNNISYILGVPTEIKTIPVYDDCARAHYTFSGRDGERSAAAKVTFGSSQSVLDLQFGYAKHFQSVGCNVSDVRAFECFDKTYSVILKQGDTCTDVDILVVGDFQ